MEGNIVTYEEQIDASIVKFKKCLAETKEEIDGLILKSGQISDNYIVCVIRNVDHLERVQHDMKQMGKCQKEIEDTRKRITKPLDGCKDAVMNYVKESKDSATKAKETMRKEIICYSDKIEAERKEQERARQAKIAEEQRKLKLAAELKDQEAVKDQVKEIDKIEEIHKEELRVAPKIDKRIAKKRWKARVIDPDEVPREHMIPDIMDLNRIARESEGKVEIPGVLFYPE